MTVTVPFSTLTKLPLSTAAGEFDINDVVFDPQTGSIPFVLIGMGGLFNSSEALIRLTRVQGINEDGTSIVTDLTENEVHAAPHIGDATVPDITGWPPLIVGPFGTTQSPLLLAAQLFGSPVKPEAELPRRFDRASDWIGAPIFGPEGEFAKIDDFHLDFETARIREITLSTSESSHIVPFFDGVRSFFSEETYAVSDLTAQDLRAGITCAERGPEPDPAPSHTWVAQRA